MSTPYQKEPLNVKGRFPALCKFSCTCATDEEHQARLKLAPKLTYDLSLGGNASSPAVKIRLDDKNLPDFWTEFEIPFEDLKKVFEEFSKSRACLSEVRA